MGGDTSQPQAGNPSFNVRSNDSYFCSTTEIGNGEPGDVERALRDLQIERLYQSAPHLRPTPSPGPSASSQVKLKTFISVGLPDPKIQIVNGIYLVTFGFKAEAPGRFILTANQMMSSFTFAAGDRTLVHFPLLAVANFLIDITPDLKQIAPTIESGFRAVTKHVLNFQLVEGGPRPEFKSVGQKLFTEDQNYSIGVSKNCELEELSLPGRCLICLENDATVAVGGCGHELVCDDCLMGRSVKLHHCPVCNAPATR
jgi:hypothetical protein